jgi:hypothetical protein
VINREITTLKFLMFTAILCLGFRRTCCRYLDSSTRLHSVTSRKTVMIIIFLFIHKLLSAGSIKHLSVKLCGGVEVQLYIFLNFLLHGSVMLHTSPLYCQRKSLRYQLSTRQGGPENPSGHSERELSTLPESNTHPVALGYSSLYWISYPDNRFAYAMPLGHLAFTFYRSRHCHSYEMKVILNTVTNILSYQPHRIISRERPGNVRFC